MAHPLRTTIAIGAIAALTALSPRGTSAAPTLTSAWTSGAPVVDGVRSANEWTGLATPLEFRWPGMTVHGRLWTQWRDDKLYLAADIAQGALANELDVVIDESNDGRLQTGEPAYLAWASGFTQQFSYDARRRGFTQDPRGTRREFRSASRRNDLARTFEYEIAVDPARPVRIALKLEHGGRPMQFDTWPTSGSRDPITRNPHEWARLTFVPSPAPRVLPPPPTPADRTPPQVSLTLSPTAPTALDEVIWYASASDASGIDRIELYTNDARTRTCSASSCDTRTGPYVAGTSVRAEARAYDRSGNVASAVQTFTSQAPPSNAAPPSGTSVSLTVPTQYTGSGNPGDRFTSAAAERNGELHLGTGPVGTVWGEPYTFSPARIDAIALAWAGIRHGMNPNYLAALAIKESRYQCLQYADGCFQVEAPTYTELRQQFPSTFRNIAYDTAVRSPYLAPQTAAFHFRFTETLFRRWYEWDSFMTAARDPFARLELLTRAYNRGAWDRNIGMILKTDRQRCIGAGDLLTCYDNNDVARDHTQAVVAAMNALHNGVTYDGDVPWADVETLLRDGVHPLSVDTNWDALVRETRSRYDALQRESGRFTFRRELPRLLTWLAGFLPPLEQPQQLQWYTAPI